MPKPSATLANRWAASTACSCGVWTCSSGCDERAGSTCASPSAVESDRLHLGARWQIEHHGQPELARTDGLHRLWLVAQVVSHDARGAVVNSDQRGQECTDVATTPERFRARLLDRAVMSGRA